MSSPDKPPALSDDELRETLEMIATVVASVSDRVDDKTVVLDRVNKTATEARQAAFAAKAQTSPKNYGKVIAETLGQHLAGAISIMDRSANALDRKTDTTFGVLNQAEKDKWDVINGIRAREHKVDLFNDRRRWFGLGAVVLACRCWLRCPASRPAPPQPVLSLAVSGQRQQQVSMPACSSVPDGSQPRFGCRSTKPGVIYVLDKVLRESPLLLRH
jgi:hypothetical protein